MESRARWSLVVAGAALALPAAQLPWFAPRLALAGSGAWLFGTGLRFTPAAALFAAVGYLGSAALLGFGPRGDLASYGTLAEIGLAVALAALLSAWRRGLRSDSGPRWAGALGILLAFAGFCGAAHAAGIAGESARWSLSLVAAPVLVFAFAGRPPALALSALAAFLALRMPERLGWLAPLGALGLALVAADALESAPREARLLAAAASALLAALALTGNPLAPVAHAGEPLDARDEWVQWEKTGEIAYTVEVDARVPVEQVLLVLVSESDGRRVERPMQREPHPGGARFSHAAVRLAQLRDPAWSVRLGLLGRDGAQIGERVIDRLVLPQAPALSPALLGFLAAALLLATVRGGGTRLALAAALLAAAQSVWLYARV